MVAEVTPRRYFAQGHGFGKFIAHFASHAASFIGTIAGRPRRDALLKPSGAMVGKKVRRMITQRNIG
jgi:hypothetical protein